MTRAKPIPLRLIAPRARPAWIELNRALAYVDPVCAKQPEVWFDESTAHVAAEACTFCPVQKLCLDYGLMAKETDGIWGGRDFYQRRRVTVTPDPP